jgi:hypothetical protein
VELYLHSPNTPSWRGAQLKRTGTTLLLTVVSVGIIGTSRQKKEGSRLKYVAIKLFHIRSASSLTIIL